MKPKHTKGPWGFEESYNDGVGNFNLLGQGMILAKLQMFAGDVEANKRLIAAAPEMFDALERIQFVIKNSAIYEVGDLVPAMALIRDVLKKAKGEIKKYEKISRR